MQFFLSTCMYKCQSTEGWAGVVLGHTTKGYLLYLTVLCYSFPPSLVISTSLTSFFPSLCGHFGLCCSPPSLPIVVETLGCCFVLWNVCECGCWCVAASQGPGVTWPA